MCVCVRVCVCACVGERLVGGQLPCRILGGKLCLKRKAHNCWVWHNRCGNLCPLHCTVSDRNVFRAGTRFTCEHNIFCIHGTGMLRNLHVVRSQIYDVSKPAIAHAKAILSVTCRSRKICLCMGHRKFRGRCSREKQL